MRAHQGPEVCVKAVCWACLIWHWECSVLFWGGEGSSHTP